MEELDSNEEIYIQWWLEELKEKGFIDSIERGVSYSLSEPVKYKVSKYLKTKVSIIEKTLLREHIYTPDFKIKWNIKAKDIFTTDITKLTSKLDLIISDEGISILEVKPVFDQNSMTRLFIINQKWMWSKHSVYVNKVIPQELFEATFTPRKYLFTNITKARRRIKFKVRTLEEFLKTFEGQQKTLF